MTVFGVVAAVELGRGWAGLVRGSLIFLLVTLVQFWLDGAVVLEVGWATTLE